MFIGFPLNNHFDTTIGIRKSTREQGTKGVRRLSKEDIHRLAEVAEENRKLPFLGHDPPLLLRNEKIRAEHDDAIRFQLPVCVVLGRVSTPFNAFPASEVSVDL